MTVEIAGLRLKNPILAASGTFGYGLEFADLLDLNDLGGFVTKGLSREPMAGNPSPRLVETPAGMLNSVGLQNVGVDAFIRDKLPRLAKLETAVIANIFGYKTEDYVEVVRRLEAAGGLAAYELNLSCPNTAGVMFASDPVLIREVTGAVRSVSRQPVWVKLSPNVSDIAPCAQAAEAAGADAISLVNTFVGIQAEGEEQKDGKQEKQEKERRVLGRGPGGLSGPVIHSRAVRLVDQAASAVQIPVIGIGGVICGADAAELLRAGAVAVEVGTANFYDPRATVRIARELAAYCRTAGMRRVSELGRGAAKKEQGRG
jgi:dihydroorotate dehydrogenase (NAD+) catalytic subunit